MKKKGTRYSLWLHFVLNSLVCPQKKKTPSYFFVSLCEVGQDYFPYPKKVLHPWELYFGPCISNLPITSHIHAPFYVLIKLSSSTSPAAVNTVKLCVPTSSSPSGSPVSSSMNMNRWGNWRDARSLRGGAAKSQTLQQVCFFHHPQWARRHLKCRYCQGKMRSQAPGQHLSQRLYWCDFWLV